MNNTPSEAYLQAMQPTVPPQLEKPEHRVTQRFREQLWICITDRCSCGGCGEGDPDACAVCELWHSLPDWMRLE